MHYERRRHYRQSLVDELQSRPLREKLDIVREEVPAFRDFKCWEGVITVLHDRSASIETKDGLLGPLLWIQQKESDPAWSTVLTVIFWPLLESICQRKGSWDEDPEEFWHTLFWTFLEVTHEIDVLRHPNWIATAIHRGTVAHLYQQYRPQWDRDQWEVVTDPTALQRQSEDLVGEDGRAIEAAADQAWSRRRLKRLHRRGVLTTSDFHLLVATEVEGQQLADYVRDHHLNYQTAKKRRQRALKWIIHHPRKLAQNADSLSPKFGLSAPLHS